MPILVLLLAAFQSVTEPLDLRQDEFFVCVPRAGPFQRAVAGAAGSRKPHRSTRSEVRWRNGAHHQASDGRRSQKVGGHGRQRQLCLRGTVAIKIN